MEKLVGTLDFIQDALKTSRKPIMIASGRLPKINSSTIVASSIPGTGGRAQTFPAIAKKICGFASRTVFLGRTAVETDRPTLPI
jgi:hypothetical protein